MSRAVTAMTAVELIAAIRAGRVTAEDAARACLSRIREREPTVKAWAWIDEALSLEQARTCDTSGLLGGVPVGIKDVFDTRDMPTQQNSALRASHRPNQDAAAVSLLRSAGAVILGKTTTQEFGAGGAMPDTRNPRDPERTPGASSSGSAAAVADGMVPLALGTQTGGSLLRPASYCGVYAMKPTWNVVSREGAMGSSLTQDTVGWYARGVDDLQLVAEALGALREGAVAPPQPDRLAVALCRTPMWPQAGEASRHALDSAARFLTGAGARIEELELPAEFARLNELSRRVMAAEGRTAFSSHDRRDRSRLHADFRAYVDKPFDAAAVLEALDFSAACRAVFDRRAAPFDLVLAPGAVDEAPRRPDKGDSVFQRMWTLLHVPCINVPGFVGRSGLPIGLTVLSGRYRDAQLLAAAKTFDSILRENRAAE